MKISEAKFAGSSTRVSDRPRPRLPEFAFIGRSNVGKSSLINMLCGNRKLALTSSTPGKTKLVNHFLINGKWYLVDLPGYGYAKMPQKERDSLQEVIKDYLVNSSEMAVLFVLLDSRLPLQQIDLNFLGMLGEHGIPFALVFTKGDKLGPVARHEKVEAVLGTLLQDWESLPPHFETSSVSGLGKEELLDYIDSILKTI